MTYSTRHGGPRFAALWRHGRRPACITRYQHGGYNAIFPLDQSMKLVFSVLGNQISATGSDYHNADGMRGSDNVIDFSHAQRKSFAHSTRKRYDRR
ncbi:MAG: hypothetical protein AAF352_08885 [Pseudomonadota bacterium]